MGCDGGTIPTRDELVKTKKKPEQKDKNAELAFRWKHCAISQEKLVQPIVACELGRLYNKESVLKVFIEKTELLPMFRHLRGMRDVKALNLTDNTAKRSGRTGTGDGYVDSGIADYICPVVGLEMSGKYKFCFLWSCGCVLSERALKEVKSKVCHKCGKDYAAEDIIPLNGTEEGETALEHKMQTRRALAKAAKKSKKADKSKVTEPQTNGHSSSSSDSTELPSSSSSGAECAKDAPSKIKSSINGDAKKSEGKSKLLSSSKDSKLTSEKAGTKRKGGIQHDPTTSKTFKSLFTSSEKAKSQQQAHWVTYNPMYY